MYIYSKDFNELWRSLENPNPPPSPVAIEWDEHNIKPDDRIKPVNAMPWLTPVHWAICAKCKWPKSSFNIRTLGDSKVFNETAAYGDQGEATSHTFLSLVRNLLPQSRSWLRFVLEDDDTFVVMKTCRSTSARELLSVVRAGFTSEDHRRSRHAIHNLILPLILNGLPSAPIDTSPDHRYALAVFLKTLAYLDQNIDSLGHTPIHSLVIDAAIREITLVDDQADHGWLQWLRSITPCADITAPQPIEFWAGVLSKRIPLTPLLLDLRLGTEFMVFVKKQVLANTQAWLDKAGHLSDEIKGSLAEDLATLKDTSDKSLSDRPASISIPARLLAVANPRVPIIIFSSTQDRAVLSKFDGFANIITGFSKGTIALAFDPSFQTRMEQTLISCIQRAMMYLRISRIAAAAEDCWKTYTNSHSPRTSHAHVELYVDETGNYPKETSMTVGGVVSVFYGSSRVDAVGAAHEYNREFLKQYSSFNFGSIKCALPYDVTKLRDTIDVISKANPKLGQLSYIQLRGAASQEKLTRRLLDVFVAMVIPLIRASLGLGMKKLSFSVFLATRTMPINVRASDPQCPYGLYPYRRGNSIRFSPGEVPRVYLTSDELASQLVDDSLNEYAPIGDNSINRLEQANTVKMAYASGYDGHRKSLSVDRIVHHRDQKRERMEIGFHSSRKAAENAALKDGWEPDVRALHEVADKCLKGNSLNVPTESWSCVDTLDLNIDAIMTAVQLMKNPKIEHLGRALAGLASLTPAKGLDRNSILYLTLANLRRLSASNWERVIYAAFSFI